MKILILSSAFSGLTQRVQRELILLGHEIAEHYDLNPDVLREQAAQFEPDVILCPFLTQRIPEDIWRQNLCLVVHPGIEGDRGPSSIDWALVDNEMHWGVTLLQADEEMDAGDIWGTRTFPLRKAGKLSVYKREVTTAAINLIKEALENVASTSFKPRPLDYSSPKVKGVLKPFMKQTMRKIDWANDSTAVVVSKILAADTSPGVIDTIGKVSVNLYGAVPESHLHGKPGAFIAVHKGAACRATKDGAVWIRQIKTNGHRDIPAIKLPASTVLAKLLPRKSFAKLMAPDSFTAVEDIRIERRGDAAYVYFDFYNGAMSTGQCMDLYRHLVVLKQSPVKTIVFMGGEDFFSNGIHLNIIEASADPALESWQNIVAIDDVVREIINCPKQKTIAALRNNAGAGGAVMTLACDEVIIRDGTVLNPHYRSMGLYGSEYWTYLVPKRVGQSTAHGIMEECKPMLAQEALDIGFVDRLFPEDWHSYHTELNYYVERATQAADFDQFLAAKAKARAADEAIRPLDDYRNHELHEMHKIFFDPNSSFHAERQRFVYKTLKQVTVKRAEREPEVA